jgi:predicted nucleotidyltransferase component of viral defense system
MSNDLNQKSVNKYKEKLKSVSLKRRANYKDVFTIFAIERAIVRLLSNEKLAKSMIFKGGFVCVRVYDSPRYTIDLDSVLHGCSIEEAQSLVPDAVQQDLSDGLWFHYESSAILKTQSDYGGLRLQFRVGFYPVLKDIRRANILHIDLGTGDPVTPMPKKLNSESVVGADDISWLVYPVETICAEKIHPFVVLGQENSRSKDVFDLSILLQRCEVSTLKQALSKTFEHRKTILPNNLFEFFEGVETAMLQRGWNAATREIKPVQPSFEECWNKILSFFQREGI